jgi:hypothetical protein
MPAPVAPRRAGPVRDGSRDGSAPPAAPRGCPVCAAPRASRRARYCSDACKQRAYRLRHAATPAAAPTVPAADRQRWESRRAHTIYECPACGERYLGEQRCPDCQRFCRALGPGGACPHCDQPILSSELLD